MHNLNEMTIGKMNPAIVYRLCAIVNYFSSLIKDFQAIRLKEIEHSIQIRRLVVIGIPEKNGETVHRTRDMVCELFEKKLYLSCRGDILVDWAFRTGSKTDLRPITVEFRNIKDRNRVYQAKDRLQSDRYFISNCTSIDCLRAHY